ncbi:MAG: phBC6A51 family helix-turn-helix protein [Clostridia bacterium]|nr:phBC6A51 family helix-turn-helix protein [Clostridia bacterium]MCI1958321.1 phBC6A51 family helix-turn-helix protein [Clostridia bacterium]MCI2000071.1 phBC6A51 family helix-turn-helix protein [Clostridia bacterium]MCI2014395.1 phBC6A51 family helix-turn-helix protein [Clostridia bacterium]
MINVGTEKKINSKQKKTAEILVGDSFNTDLTNICETAGISLNTLYQWLGTEEFRKYLDCLVDKVTIGEVASVWKSLLEQCIKGNVQAIKLYFELKNKYKQDTNVAAMNLVQILDDIPKDKKDG